MLTEADVLGFRKFRDGIAHENYLIDIHRPGLTHLPPGAYHEIPYRFLVLLGVVQLLVARAMSLAARIPPRQVNGVQLPQKLIFQGACL